MAGPIDMAVQLAGNTARLGWYTGINWLMRREGLRRGPATEPYEPKRPVPSREDLMASIRELLRADAEAVRDGLYPPMPGEELRLREHLSRLRAMARDLAGTTGRRHARDASTARDLPQAAGLPDYFTQDFHFQTGGYLSRDSARLYDVQVETLFYGAAAVMRRAGLRTIASHMLGRDQRQTSLLDVACGTGRFLRDVRLAFPAMHLTGLDLSAAYLEEARVHMGSLRPATFLAANAEDIPLGDATQDIVSCVFLFHELPPDVRRRVAGELARVLKPGGLLVFIDSLQMGDKPGWDGLLEAFPVRFHEPYYRNYAIDDLDALFESFGLAARATELAFLSKVMVREKR
ncbi:MAG: class I SAM-dependent methyltransferase [Hyphomicrobiaceae bacterium]|nr:class I SAM-dependent methyltransferase [Hyphomicrobiaceae bacterium]